jgi:hypothetical protein
LLVTGSFAKKETQPLYFFVELAREFPVARTLADES